MGEANHPLFLSLSYPKGNNDEKHLEEDAEDHVARERQRHDAKESRRGTDHDRGTDLSHCVGDTSVLGDVLVLLFTRQDKIKSKLEMKLKSS